MSRRECRHGKSCGHEWCYLEDPGCILPPCDEFEDSGWRQKYRTEAQVAQTIKTVEERIAALKPVFGQREKFERKMNGYRGVLARARNEITRH